MSSSRRKEPPVIPVVGQGGDSSREEQLREWEEAERLRREQAAAAAAQPSPVVPAPAVPAPATPVPGPAPEVPLPDPASDPGDQLAVCERGIHGAKARWKAKVDGATEAFIEEAGPYLCWVHEHKLYKLMLDNSGKLYRSFRKYLKEQHDLPPRTGYRITQTIPLLTILRGAGRQLDDLSARQVAVLHPVRIQHGGAAVLKVWGTASATMKGVQPTPDELEKAKTLLGLSTKPDPDDEPDALTSAGDVGAAVERAARILVPETVREAVKKDPERIRGLVRVLNAALTEAGEPVD